MIASSRIAKASALVIALAAHGALALTLVAPEAPQSEGTAGAAEVRLGNAFADMAAGTLAAQPADTEADVSDVERATPQTAEPTPRKTPPEHAQEAMPEETEAVTPDRPDRVEVESADPAARARASVARQADPEGGAPPSLPDRIAALPSADIARAALPADTLPPAKAQPSPSPRTAERLTGADPANATVARSLRPRMRDKSFEAAHKTVTKPQPAKKQKAQPTQSGAASNARAGETTGTETASAPSSGTEGRQKEAGNAAASNYPGLVRRKLARAGKPRVNARGTVVVAFTISSGGGLASVSLAQSSGNGALDQAAVRLVRNAAPFPEPPSGARRTFSIEIKGG
ncbi:outer membrane transport energization protein TonB [Salinihabitans flavidus]|uniref:Outer membrane transport energization protein TonB n=1 Tax=Salinihabitans flavidus TaxID=569882 RepID=A0A1H8W2I0_9RHOB|nr:energy transducer TonB [Salinihabitans flavidus]SEP21687.1 outer membrane transport energization protein TonB [Salinihabitans flavidus]